MIVCLYTHEWVTKNSLLDITDKFTNFFDIQKKLKSIPIAIKFYKSKKIG